MTTAQMPRWSRYINVLFFGGLSTIFLMAGIPYGIRHLIGCMAPDCGNYTEDLAFVMDTSKDPCTDFYDYVCGNWNRSQMVPLPNQFVKLQSRVALTVLRDLMLIDETAEPQTAVVKAGLMFQRCAQNAFNQLDHLGEIKNFMAQFDLSWPPESPKTRFNVLDILVELTFNRGIPIFFSLGPSTYFKKRGSYNLHLTPNLYLLEWAAFRKMLRNAGVLMRYYEFTAYVLSRKHLESNLAERLALLDNNLITAIGVVTGSRPDIFVNYATFAELENVTGPAFTGGELMRAVNKRLSRDRQLTLDDELTLVGQTMVRITCRVIGHSMGSETLRAYVALQLMRQLAATSSFTLSSALFPDSSNNAMLAVTYMIGHCFADVLSILPYVADGLFVKHWVPAGNIEAVRSIVKTMRNVTEDGFLKLSWMDGPTRSKSMSRIHTLHELIGYPKEMMRAKASETEYAHIPHLGGTYFQMSTVAREATQALLNSFIKSPQRVVRAMEFGLPMIMVNAFYMPIYHFMVIPAAIMFPPFFSKQQPSAVNYGSLGHVIGHEITHAFDPEMGLYNELGLKENWWTATSRKSFEDRVRCLAEFYNNVGDRVANDVRFGDTALSENFADCGGLDKSYRAFKRYSDKQLYSVGDVQLTADQLFFVSTCYKWCSDDSYTQREVSMYSPLRMRCNVPLMNMPEFADAFQCASDTAMNPRKRCDLL
ncbi:neprilysin-11-like [Ornithodoros turicata]|uniref:neprilysin-11-like n=1 Tax=Ornithodoros turicata TaxID=34597 RepID=UPI003138996B